MTFMIFKEFDLKFFTNPFATMSTSALLKTFTSFYSAFLSSNVFSKFYLCLSACTILIVSALLVYYLLVPVNFILVLLPLSTFFRFLALANILKNVMLLALLQSCVISTRAANILMICLFFENLLFTVLLDIWNKLRNLSCNEREDKSSFWNVKRLILFVFMLLLVSVSIINPLNTGRCLVVFLSISWYCPYRLLSFIAKL